jgi:D-aminopeptidase
LNYDTPRIARTGVTMILPRGADSWSDPCFAATHRFNGNGEMTGTAWIAESGMLTTPIGITNTHQVGIVRDTMVEYARSLPSPVSWLLPVVAETYDGRMNDIDAFHVKREHVWAAIENARDGAVDEGNVGGGTGMRCHEFKGGIGTSSRMVSFHDTLYHVGALVQANYGSMGDLRLDGVPIGRELMRRRNGERKSEQGSIIIVLATDAPLLPTQCERLAQRATVGLGNVGGHGHNSSGDLFLAFSTGNHLAANGEALIPLQMMPNEALDRFFDATIEAVQEAIWNALTAAETMKGFQLTLEAIPLDEVVELYKR